MAVIDRVKKCVFVKGRAYPGIPLLFPFRGDIFVLDEDTLGRFPDETKEIMLDVILEFEGVTRENIGDTLWGRIFGMRLVI
jgi:hypothetical protein